MSKALASSRWAWVQAWAAVPIVVTPYQRPACRLEVASKPTSMAARAAATADPSWVRRDPISSTERSPAAPRMRAALVAMALSWLTTDRMRVSSRTASPKRPSTVTTGEPGKYSSPSA